jgi:hypothetical protein
MSMRQCFCMVLFMGLCFLAGCAKAPPRVPVASTGDRRPFVFVHQLSGNPLPSAPPASGILVAVWNDGRIVRVAAGSQPGQRYVQGHVSQAKVEELRRLIESSGVTQQQDGGKHPVDASSERLVLRLPQGVLVWVHSPPIFVDSRITRITKYMMELEWSDETTVEGAMYSGYPHDWYEGWNQ